MTRKGAKPAIPRGMRQRARADGTVRLFWEPPADARKLGFNATDLPDSFADAIRKAAMLNARVDQARATGKRLADEGRPQQRRIEALIADYRTSVHWTEGLKPKTRQSYDRLLAIIAAKWGQDRAADFDKATMHEWYQSSYRARGPRTAQALIRMMSILMEHAETLGWRAENTNPCLRLKIKTPPPRHRAATMDEVAALLAGAEALGLRAAGLAIRLAVLQGQRQTDILAARRGDFGLADLPGAKGQAPRKLWVWRLTRSKRGNATVLPINPDALPGLRAALLDTGTATAPLRDTDPLIRDEATGRGYAEDLFAKRWAAIRAWAASPEGGNQPAIASLQFRDLRRTWATLARAAGVSLNDVGDVLGNSLAVSARLEETYTPATIETTARAIAAVHLPVSASATTRKGKPA